MVAIERRDWTLNKQRDRRQDDGAFGDSSYSITHFGGREESFQTTAVQGFGCRQRHPFRFPGDQSSRPRGPRIEPVETDHDAACCGQSTRYLQPVPDRHRRGQRLAHVLASEIEPVGIATNALLVRFPAGIPQRACGTAALQDQLI